MKTFRRALGAAMIIGALHAFAPLLTAQTTQSGPDNPPAEQSYNPIPRRLVWPGIAVIILIAIFVTAALAGPLIRANQDESDSTDSSDQTR